MAAAEPSPFRFSPRPNRAHEVNWRPWSQQAFEEARALDRPILLAISAVWCHWCHVMDETTYSSRGVIDLINSEYVPIRVDNDVRPDINQRYNMGGWPTTAFLTSSGEILTGATYMPPEQMEDALGRVAAYYQTHRAEIATKVLESRKRMGSIATRSAGDLDPALVKSVLQSVKMSYDSEYGGFGTAPKFPQTDAILLLLEQARLRGDPALRDMAVTTLQRMAEGGMYDHIEGGFFRYSTTQDWSVPHFEKMLEDHAGLVDALAHAGMTEELDRTTAFLDRVLRDPATGLYAGSQDADEHYYALDAHARARLAPPYVDRRVYSGWNAALAAAYLGAARLCDRPHLRDGARRTLESLFDLHYRPGEGLAHTAGVGGQLGDQVWGMLAAVRAYGSGLGERWRELAAELANHLDERFADGDLGGYFDHAGGEAGLGLGRLDDPVKPLVENSIAAIALSELDALEGDPGRHRLAAARRCLQSVAALPPQYGLMAAVFARALDRTARSIKVTTGSEALARAALEDHPYVVVEPSQDERAVVCFGSVCLAPVSTSQELHEAIGQAANTSA